MSRSRGEEELEGEEEEEDVKLLLDFLCMRGCEEGLLCIGLFDIFILKQYYEQKL